MKTFIYNQNIIIAVFLVSAKFNYLIYIKPKTFKQYLTNENRQKMTFFGSLLSAKSK